MKTLTIILLLVCVVVSRASACDAERYSVIPGMVIWCDGCCDNEGYSWIELGGNSYLHHADAGRAASVPIGVAAMGVVTVACITGRRMKKRRIEKVRPTE